MSKKFNSSRFVNQIKPVAAGKSRSRPLDIVILASDMGYRMKSYGPKCLLKTHNNETIISRQINLLQQEFTDCNITIVVGFEADKIIKHVDKGIKIIENQLYEYTNSVENIRLVLNNIRTSNLLIIDGDLIFNPQTLKIVTKNSSSVIMDSNKMFDGDKEGATIVDNQITNFSYGLDSKWARIVFLTGKELATLSTECFNREKNKLYLFEILNIVIDKGGTIHSICDSDIIVYKIDSTKNLSALKDKI